MGTITLSARLAKDEAKKIDELAADLGLDRGALLKQLIRKGLKDIQTERALDAYRRGTITLSRAAEIAEFQPQSTLNRVFPAMPANAPTRALPGMLSGWKSRPE